MSYEMEVISTHLECSRETADTLQLGVYKTYMDWVLVGTDVLPLQETFHDMKGCVCDLLKLSGLGITGTMELQGQCGDHIELHIRGDTVEEHFGRITYVEKPDTVYHLAGGRIQETVVSST